MQVGNLCGEYAKGRRKSAEPDRRDALCGWYVCSGVSKSDKVWSRILSEELFSLVGRYEE